ncbi:hypothetical protein CMI37_12730 [Candidatus Pacearchaeota archaeon]|nr:hypothetical protein [Candidatus Pacearchaeota archaeon]|tara:strand:+ start:1240 stop:1614 length:375 start_codon:yes stop_codon:yes gene_type:complete
MFIFKFTFSNNIMKRDSRTGAEQLFEHMSEPLLTAPRKILSQAYHCLQEIERGRQNYGQGGLAKGDGCYTALGLLWDLDLIEILDRSKVVENPTVGTAFRQRFKLTDKGRTMYQTLAREGVLNS